MYTVRVPCPNPACRTLLSVPARLGGQKVRCACCGQVVRVPDRPSLRKRRKPSSAA